MGTLKKARCPVQLDVGYGDAVTPGPEEAVYPTLLDDLPAPRLRVYPRETVIAEKLEAIATLGMANSRMKDYFDLRALAHEGATDPRILSEAIRATFERRRTPLPAGIPQGSRTSSPGTQSSSRNGRAFLVKNRLEAPPLDIVVGEVRSFLEVPLSRASKRQEPV